MSRTRIKICGITRPEDAACAAELGVDAIGLNFVGGPRQIELERATAIERGLPPLVSVVALLQVGINGNVNPDVRERIVRWFTFLDERTHYIQAYNWKNISEESSCRLTSSDSKYWAVFSVTNRYFSREVAESLAVNAAERWPASILLDTASSTQLGGTGQTFNWHWIAEARAAGELEGLPPIVLAGGLTPDNVAEAIRIARPYAVDVSSGVEVPGKPGIKDPIKMRDFIQAAQSV